MLPYRFRRRLPLFAVSALAVAAAVVLLPSTEPVTSAATLSAAVEPTPQNPSFIAAPPVATTDDIVTGSVAPTSAAPQTFSKPTGAVQTTGLATLTVTATPIPSATATEVDAAAAVAEVTTAPRDIVHVGSSAVNVRAGPTTSARKLFVLQPGDAVSAAEVADGWVRIVRPDGEGGWVYARYLNGVPGVEPVEQKKPAVTREVRMAEAMPEKGEVRRVSGKSVRLSGPVTLRDAPSKSANRLFVLERGERIVLAEVDNGWARVVLPSGVSGWIQVR
jgi:SH3-like domain-containing protein